MKQYDVTCPICKTTNKGLFLDETDGWMIRDNCGAEVLDVKYAKQRAIVVPIFRIGKDADARALKRSAV